MEKKDKALTIKKTGNRGEKEKKKRKKSYANALSLARDLREIK